MINRTKLSEIKILPMKLFKMLPIFESVNGKIFFKDKTISILELHLDFDFENVVTILPMVYYNNEQLKFTFRIEYQMDLKEGWIKVKNDYILPDHVCMELYGHNIDVLSSMLVDNKNLYDRLAIERRMIIKNIIEHE